MKGMRRVGAIVILALVLPACGHEVKVGRADEPGSLISSDEPSSEPSVSRPLGDAPSTTPSPTATGSSSPKGDGFGGRVTDTAGHPIEGMCVSITDLLQQADFAREAEKFMFPKPVSPIVARSAADGTYSVLHSWPRAIDNGPIDWWPNPWKVEFWDCRATPVFGPEILTIAPIGVISIYDPPRHKPIPDSGFVANVDVRLHVGGTIAGTVVDEHGAPAAGACVAAFNDIHSDNIYGVLFPEYVVRADADGHFKISGLAPTGPGPRVNSDMITSYGVLFGDCIGSPYAPEWYSSYIVPPGDCYPCLPSGDYSYEHADPILVRRGATTDTGTMTLHPPSPRPSPTPTQESPSPSPTSTREPPSPSTPASEEPSPTPTASSA